MPFRIFNLFGSAFFEQKIEVNSYLYRQLIEAFCCQFACDIAEQVFKLLKSNNLLHLQIVMRNILGNGPIVIHKLRNLSNFQLVFLQLPLILQLILSFFLNLLVDDLTHYVFFLHLHDDRMQLLVHHSYLSAASQIVRDEVFAIGDQLGFVEPALEEVEVLVFSIQADSEHKQVVDQELLWDLLLGVEDEEAPAVFMDCYFLILNDQDLRVVADHEGLGKKGRDSLNQRRVWIFDENELISLQ